MTGGSEAEQVQGAQLFGDAFALLGVRQLAGRGLGVADARSNVVVLSERLWRRRYGGDLAILGALIRMNGEPYTVVGIMLVELPIPATGRGAVDRLSNHPE